MGAISCLGALGRLGRTTSVGDMLFAPRYVSSFELTDTQTLMLGASGAFGSNARGSDARTEVYGADLFWKWKPASQNGGFPFVSWQTEGMLRRFKAAAYDGLLDPANPTPALPEETPDRLRVLFPTLLGFPPGLGGRLARGLRHRRSCGILTRTLIGTLAGVSPLT